MIALVLIGIAAVTLLDEPRPNPETTAPAPTIGRDEAAPAPRPEPVFVDPEGTLAAIGDQLGLVRSFATSSSPVPPDPCWPDGYGVGAQEEWSAAFQGNLPDATGPSISVTSYGNEEAAADDLDRIRTSEWRACDEQITSEEHDGAPVTVEALPDEATVPAALVWEKIEDPSEPDRRVLIFVVVGRLRATLEFFDVTMPGSEGQRQLARDVAAVLADQQ